VKFNYSNIIVLRLTFTIHVCIKTFSFLICSLQMEFFLFELAMLIVLLKKKKSSLSLYSLDFDEHVTAWKGISYIPVLFPLLSFQVCSFFKSGPPTFHSSHLLMEAFFVFSKCFFKQPFLFPDLRRISVVKNGKHNEPSCSPSIHDEPKLVQALCWRSIVFRKHNNRYPGFLYRSLDIRLLSCVNSTIISKSANPSIIEVFVEMIGKILANFLVVKTQENIISLSRKEKHQENDNWEQTHWTGWWIHDAETRRMEVSDGNGVKRQRWEDFQGVIRQTAGNWKWKNEKGERVFFEQLRKFRFLRQISTHMAQIWYVWSN